jgi:hypothetical protein
MSNANSADTNSANRPGFFKNVATALLSGAVLGALLSSSIVGGTYFLNARTARQDTNARELLLEALNILSYQEAWLLQGPGSQKAKLIDNRDLKQTPLENGLWLMPVEVRAILDEAEWNTPIEESYSFLNGRRAWIVRDHLTGKMDFEQGLATVHFPALLSSKGRQELGGWVERVQMAYSSGALSEDGLAPLKLYLDVVAPPTRVNILRRVLTPQAQGFLTMIWQQSAQLAPAH